MIWLFSTVILSILTIVFALLWLTEKKKIQTALDAHRQIENEKIRLEAQLQMQTNLDKERKESFESLRKEFENSFNALAAQALEGNNKQFLDLAKSVLDNQHSKGLHFIESKSQSIDNLVKPLTAAIEKYQIHNHEMIKERERGLANVESELKRVVESNFSLARETGALKDALKKPNVRGRWGELQLKNCIELAGMSEYCDVSFQDTYQDDGNQLRPDMIVKMPGGRVVVVDAKTPLDAFIAALEAQTEAERATQLIRHGKHIKDHIKKLSTKEYAQTIGNSADFTVLFLPNESFLYAGLETQRDLVEYAIEHKILLATPPTLIGLLKVVRYGWNEERLAENAVRISDAGIELHKRVCEFVETYINVGKSLDRASKEYEAGLVRLNSRVIVQAKRLENLGAKSNKELPAAPLEEL